MHDDINITTESRKYRGFLFNRSIIYLKILIVPKTHSQSSTAAMLEWKKESAYFKTLSFNN